MSVLFSIVITKSPFVKLQFALVQRSIEKGLDVEQVVDIKMIDSLCEDLSPDTVQAIIKSS